jgi:hypothetical protein
MKRIARANGGKLGNRPKGRGLLESGPPGEGNFHASCVRFGAADSDPPAQVVCRPKRLNGLRLPGGQAPGIRAYRLK